MDTLPFKINFFKQLEIFQEVRRLDEQFDLQLIKWKSGAFKKNGLSEKLNINYPTWELEKKILLWTALNHKHLGSSLAISHLTNQEFQNDIFSSETELGFAGKEEVLKNLVARGFAIWDNGALINKEGLNYGLLIWSLYKIEKDKKIKENETKFREFTLRCKKINYWGYNFIYFSAISLIIASLFIISITITQKMFGACFFVFSSAPHVIKYLITVVIFLPLLFFISGFFMIKKK